MPGWRKGAAPRRSILFRAARLACVATLLLATLSAAAAVAEPREAPASEALVLVQNNGETREVADAPPDFSSDLPIFEPTHQWQEVLEGQHIPGGLHVKLDMANGKKYAKLMDGSSDGHISDTAGKQSEELAVETKSPARNPLLETAPEEATVSPDDLVGRAEVIDRVLRQLPTPPAELDSVDRTIDPEKWQEVLHTLWKKRQKEILAAEQAIHDSARAMTLAADSLADPGTSREDKLRLLQSMEQEVRQIDNAHDFFTVGGLAATIGLLGDSDRQVRLMAAWVVGTATRNYEKVQLKALELGGLDRLLVGLRNEIEDLAAEGSAEREHTLRTAIKFWHAISSLSLGNDPCFSHLLRLDGLDVMRLALQASVSVLGDSPSRSEHQLACKLRSRVLSFLTDALMMRRDISMRHESCAEIVRSSALSCTGGPARETALRAMDAIVSRGLCPSAASAKSDNSEGTRLLQAAWASAFRAMEEWDQEWARDLESDPQDDYAKELRELVRQAKSSSRSRVD